MLRALISSVLLCFFLAPGRLHGAPHRPCPIVSRAQIQAETAPTSANARHTQSVPSAAAQTATVVAVEPAVAAPMPSIPASRTLRQSVLVESSSGSATAMGDPEVHATRAEIETTAGTLDDPARYFQIVPGVQSDSDQRNDFLVRGGNPSENLFVIDGIEVPSINHLALSDTTGGLVSMVDADAIESMTLHSGAHDARFDDRLSSVVEISTMKEGSEAADNRNTRRVAEAGIAGVGGIVSWKMGGRSSKATGGGSMLVSVREGILDLLTSNIGLNGVPKYTNAFLRGDRMIGSRDKVWGMSLSGIDSIAITPAMYDPDETNPFDIRYHGWRSTTGVNWQHLWSANNFGVLTASNAQQSQNVVERDQLLGDAETYTEHTGDGATTVKYELTSQWRAWLLLSAGATTSIDRVNYVLAQPVPLPSPYSVGVTSASGSQGSGPTATATSLNAAFSTRIDGGFAQGTLLLPRGVRFTTATRLTHWGFGGQSRWTPRAFVSVPLGGSRTIAVGYADYAQMPAYLYRLAFAQNRGLEPIKAQHLTLDLQELVRTRRFRLQIGAYDKRYTRYPVASGFPQLSLANIADTFGQSFQLFPMASKGRGRASGVEATMEYRPVSRLMLQGSVTYARCRYSGLDGVLRPGNYDIPLSAKVAGVLRVSQSLSLSARYDAASGRPYTPDNMAESEAQDRDVYNIQRVNGARSHAYGRLDLRVQQTRPFGKGTISWHVGLENALNQKNFYEYVWQPRTGGVSEQDQMPLFPDGGVKYSF
jgi:hypothetical protein